MAQKTNIVNKYKPVKKVASNNYLHTTNISNIYEVILRVIFKTNKQNCYIMTYSKENPKHNINGFTIFARLLQLQRPISGQRLVTNIIFYIRCSRSNSKPNT